VIKKSDTPAKLGLRNDDTINFFTEKNGGGYAAEVSDL
jgi:hypothetical protein